MRSDVFLNRIKFVSLCNNFTISQVESNIDAKSSWIVKVIGHKFNKELISFNDGKMCIGQGCNASEIDYGEAIGIMALSYLQSIIAVEVQLVDGHNEREVASSWRIRLEEPKDGGVAIVAIWIIWWVQV